MKNTFLILAFISLYTAAFAQMNYQCVILDTNDDPVATSAIGVRASVRLNSAAGTISYQETHAATTDNFGRMNIVIGEGVPVTGTYANVPRTGTHFLEIEVDLNGGTDYQPLATTQIYPGFKADEIDPVFAASPAAGITANDISNWNNAGGGSVVELTAANLATAQINANDIVDIQEVINLAANFSAMNDDRLLITGGGFSGTGTQTVQLGSYSTVSNVYFKDVILSGFEIQFVNCFFEGAVRMPSNSSISGGHIFNGNIPTNVSLRNVTLCHIENTTLPRVENITHCKIEFSTIGNATNTAQIVSNCDIDDSTIHINGQFTGNNCDQTTIKINDNVNFANIDGNEFDEFITGESFIIVINRTSTAAQHQVKISNNIFWGDNSSVKHIQVNGNYSNGSFDSIVHIIGNSFTRGTQAIEHNATGINMIVSNNILNALSSIGVTASSDIILIDNTLIP